MNLANPLDPTFVKLMAHLYRGGTFGYYWIASEARNKELPHLALEQKTFWFEVGKPAYLPSDKGPHGERHLYYGIHPTTAIPPTNSAGEPRKPHQVRSQKAYIAAINCLFGEYDAKDYEGGKEAILGHIDGLKFPPSVLIDSVGGFHAYWLLKDTFQIKSDADRAKVDALQKAWVPFVGSDKEAKDITRVLRIPGTRNYKAVYAPSHPLVKVVWDDFDTLYSLDELEAALPEPIKEHAPNKPSKKHDRPMRDVMIDAAKYLDMLASWRCEDYAPEDGAWLGVGMALSELGAAGLQLWEDWSRGSSKYKSGQCEEKWKTFKPGAGLTLGSLAYWAKEDSPVAYEEYRESFRKPKAKTERKANIKQGGYLVAPRLETPEMEPPPAPPMEQERASGKGATKAVARPLPYKVRSEEIVLGTLIDNEEAFSEVQGLAPEDFYQRKHQWIYEAMVCLYARGCGFDLVTLADELEAMACAVSEDELSELQYAASPKNLSHHAKTVSELAKARRLIGAAQRIEKLGYTALNGDIESALVEAESILLGVTQEKRASGGPRPLAELLPASEARLVEMNRIGKPMGIQAVPESLNELIGGWQPGKLYIPAGYPGDGKTSWMLANFQEVANRGEDCLILTLEMTNDELIQKMIGSEGRIDSHLLNSGPLDGDNLRRARRAIATMAEKTRLWIDDTPALTWIDVATRVKQVDLALRRVGRSLKMVGIDYIQRMQHIRHKGGTDADAITQTATRLKDLAKEMKIPVIVNSQFSRDGAKTKRRPILQDLRGSGGLEQEADTVIFVYYSDSDGKPDEPDLIVEKNRTGRTGVRRVHFDRAHNIWRDVGHSLLIEPQGYRNGNGNGHHEHEW